MKTGTTFLPAAALDTEKPAPGVYVGVPFDTYCRAKAVNHSTLKGFRHSPLHVHESFHAPSTPEQRLGSAAHHWLLERPTFWEKYALWEGSVRRGQKWEQWQAENANKESITPEGFAEVQEISKGVGRHPTAEKLRRAHGHAECVLVWMDPTGVLCKARCDKLIEASTNIVLDIKTTMDASTPAFSRSIERYRYDTQAAMYERGARVLGMENVRFVLLPIESSPPYAARTLDLGPRTRKNAADILNAWLTQYANCQKAGNWPGYEDRIVPIDISDWALRGVEEEVE